MAHYSIVAIALFIIACGPRSEHPSGTCSGSAGISQAGSYTPPTVRDAGVGDAVITTGDVGEPSSDAGLNAADATSDQQSGDSG